MQQSWPCTLEKFSMSSRNDTPPLPLICAIGAATPFSHLPLKVDPFFSVVPLMLYLRLCKKLVSPLSDRFSFGQRNNWFFFLIGKTEQQGNPAAIFPLLQTNSIIAVLQYNLALPICCFPHFACKCQSFC